MVSKGFTLIELMVVVAIVAILAAVAVPSYQQHVIESRRAECTAFALDIASRQERHWTRSRPSAYTTSANFVAELGMPNDDQSENGLCTVTMSDTINSFEVTVAVDPADAECGSFRLNNIGQKSIVVEGVEITGAQAAECWR